MIFEGTPPNAVHAVSLLAQALEDLPRAIGVRVQQSRDASLEGVQHTAALGWAGPLETGACQPRGDGLAMKTERAGNLGDGQSLTIPAVVDPGECLVVDHDRLRGQGGDVGGPRDMARMSWPRRNKRSVVRTRSSCSGVPTR
jgi:hypothetical protein